LNDSLKVLSSLPLLQNPSCTGRIETEVKDILTNRTISKVDCMHTDGIGRFHLRYLCDDVVFSFSGESSKKYFFLGFSYSFGKYYDKLYKNINDLIKKKYDDAVIYVVCLDPVYELR
jgi:hypothetical protein